MQTPCWPLLATMHCDLVVELRIADRVHRGVHGGEVRVVPKPNKERNQVSYQKQNKKGSAPIAAELDAGQD